MHRAAPHGFFPWTGEMKCNLVMSCSAEVKRRQKGMRGCCRGFPRKVTGVTARSRLQVFTIQSELHTNWRLITWWRLHCSPVLCNKVITTLSKFKWALYLHYNRYHTCWRLERLCCQYYKDTIDVDDCSQLSCICGVRLHCWHFLGDQKQSWWGHAGQ